jgi:DNA-binding transcriptional LysR family regulator
MNVVRAKDLNLLSVLLALAEDPHLTRVAEGLGLSQPALSHALKRLREQFGDPLFVRGGRGLIPTPKLISLIPRVRAVLEMAGAIYGPAEALDLATVRRRVVIACTAYFEVRALGPLISHAAKVAPGVRFETRSLAGGFPRSELESGEFDLAIAAYFTDLPRGYRLRTIFSDQFVSVCGAKNSYVRTRRRIGDYLRCQHLQIEVPPGVIAPVERYLQAKGLSREIALRIGNFLTPARILSETDYLLTCPSSLAHGYAEAYPLAVTALPFPLPSIETTMVWHERSQADPFHAWLRGRIAESGHDPRPAGTRGTAPTRSAVNRRRRRAVFEGRSSG